MKQTLSLTLLGALCALAAVIDAPIVLQAFAMCGNSLVSYEGTGWFAGGAAALAAVLLGLALVRLMPSTPPHTPHQRGIESIATGAEFEPGIVDTVPLEVFPGPADPFGLPLIDVPSG